MLRTLSVKNFALIDSLEVNFGPQLNIITGETGAGKSLLLGALAIVLGEKTGSRTVRDGNRPCIIELDFSIKGLGLEDYFEENDLDYDDTIIIRRIISPNNKVRNFINDIPVNVSVLKSVASRLIDIHSQHQSLLIQNEDYRRNIVDDIAQNLYLRKEYLRFYKELRETEKKLDTIIADKEDSSRELEFLKYQYEELSRAKLRETEYEELEETVNMLSNSLEIKDSLLYSERLLSEDETGILILLKNIENSLNRIQGFSNEISELYERIRSVYYELKDISQELYSLGDVTESDPEKFERSTQRLDLLNRLITKYKVKDIKELIKLGQTISEKFTLASDPEEEIQRLRGHIIELRNNCTSLAEQISHTRKKAAHVIEEYVCSTASKLGMPNINFKVFIEKKNEITPYGYNSVKYLFTSNKNSEPDNIEKIASGGEMSRIMLCIKSLLAQHKKLPAIVFDEIDTGVSGETASKMGEIIESLSKYMQIINITHLPQVASKGSSHYTVYKQDTETATNTCIKKLTEKERVNEIAKMLSGSNITNAAIQQAQTLLNK